MDERERGIYETCDCTVDEGNTVTPRQVRIWHDGTSDQSRRGPAVYFAFILAGCRHPIRPGSLNSGREGARKASWCV